MHKLVVIMVEPHQLHQKLLQGINRRSLVGKRNYALLYLLTHTPLNLATILDLTVNQLQSDHRGTALVWGQDLAIAPFWSASANLAAAIQDWRQEFNQQYQLQISSDLPQQLFVAVDRANFGKALSYVSGYQILRAVAEAADLTLTPKTLQKYIQKDSPKDSQTYRWQYRFNLRLLSQASLREIFGHGVELPAMGGLIFLAANSQALNSGSILWIEAVQNLQQSWQSQTRYHHISQHHREAVLAWMTITEVKTLFAEHLPRTITKYLDQNSRHNFTQNLLDAAIAQFQPIWQGAAGQPEPNQNIDLVVSDSTSVTPVQSAHQISEAYYQTNPSRDLIALLLAERRSENTRRAYAKDLQYFFVTMYGVMPHPEILDQFLAQNRFVAIGQVLRYKSHLIEQGLKEATVNRRLAALRALVNHAQKLGRCDWTLQDISSERIFPYRDTTGLPVAGIRQILAEINRHTLVGKRNYAILRLLWENALRRNEVISCNRGDFDPDQRTLAILGKGKGSQKSLVSLSIGLTESIQDYLSHVETLKSDEPLFISLSDQRYGRRLSGATLYKLVRQTTVTAGIQKIMSPHRIRHSAITAALDATNGNVRKVQKLSRHKKIDTLMLYDDNRTNAQGEISDLLSNLF